MKNDLSGSIKVFGARMHNLKNVDIEIPRNKLVVITGLSGSGKSSLAFDTLYAEGQRRYVESLSSYARQFLDRMDKPDVDEIQGLSPAISIEQKTSSKNPRSTVATVTEIYDYLRLLFARLGKAHCPDHPEVALGGLTRKQIADEITLKEKDLKLIFLAPMIRDKKGTYKAEFARWLRDGFTRVRVDGEIMRLDEEIKLRPTVKHEIEIVVDRMKLKDDSRQRINEAIDTAMDLSSGTLKVLVDEEELFFSENSSCTVCGKSYPKLEPKIFSFNSPHGACQACDGLGKSFVLSEEKLVPVPSLSIAEGAIALLKPEGKGYIWQILKQVADEIDIDLNKPFSELTHEEKEIIFRGTEEIQVDFTVRRRWRRHKFRRSFQGILHLFQRRYEESSSDYMRNEIEKFMVERNCQACGGKRLSPFSLNVLVKEHSIADICDMTIREADEFFKNIRFTGAQFEISRLILKAIQERLGFLSEVGVGYLNLGRSAASLSGGEAQRIRLASQIGASLVGVMYVLDEPSIGLHQRDNEKLIATLKRLRDVGNTVIVVEHDEDTMRCADQLIDIGPGAGVNGGKVVAQGTPLEVEQLEASITGQYLSGQRKIALPEVRREAGNYISLIGASGNNLKSVNVDFPLNSLVCVTGVSGSGKSTLVTQTLLPFLKSRIHRSGLPIAPCKEIKGWEKIDKVIEIDQSPIGRTPRSNPATYTDVFGIIRTLFAGLPEAKARGYKPGRFSFNVKGGRCETCQGAGFLKIEMHFLPDIYVSCDHCKGSRFNPETLEVLYKEKSIADVLNMTVDEALDFFAAIPTLKRRLKTMQDVGLGYISLGQSATTLSGGEAQRIKLSRELGKVYTGNTLYILDEPTTGLHLEDVKRLIHVLGRLIDHGNSVIVIEHNLDVIKCADHIIDLGPEGGKGGGQLIASGSPEKISRSKKSYTGHFLKALLKNSKK